MKKRRRRKCGRKAANERGGKAKKSKSFVRGRLP
jgi:hypothetical protein